MGSGRLRGDRVASGNNVRSKTLPHTCHKFRLRDSKKSNRGSLLQVFAFLTLRDSSNPRRSGDSPCELSEDRKATRREPSCRLAILFEIQTSVTPSLIENTTTTKVDHPSHILFRERGRRYRLSGIGRCNQIEDKTFQQA